MLKMIVKIIKICASLVLIKNGEKASLLHKFVLLKTDKKFIKKIK